MPIYQHFGDYYKSEPEQLTDKSMYKSFKVAKPSEPNRTSEDAVLSEPFYNENGVWFGIADGAGGDGYFCGEWAQYLVNELKTQPNQFKTIQELDAWVEGFYQTFTHLQKEKIPDSDIIGSNKFSLQGANSTLSAVWINNKQLSYLCYGDSCIFIYRNNKLIVLPEYFADDISQFSGSTYLINSQQNVAENGFVVNQTSINLLDGDTILLATDALSQFLILTDKSRIKQDKQTIINELVAVSSPLATTIESVYNLAETRNTLSELLDNDFNQDKFEELCTELYNTNAILPDDYSLIIYQYKEV